MGLIILSCWIVSIFYTSTVVFRTSTILGFFGFYEGRLGISWWQFPRITKNFEILGANSVSTDLTSIWGRMLTMPVIELGKEGVVSLPCWLILIVFYTSAWLFQKLRKKAEQVGADDR